MASPVVRQALDRTYRMDYPGAEDVLLQGLPSSSPARPYFAGIVCLNRFLDWGDTAALSRAEAWFDRIPPSGDVDPALRGSDPAELSLYRGLAGFQQSFIAALRGQRVRPTALALAARGQLLPLERPEARAALILYGYYRGQILDKLPFVHESAFPVAEFRQTAQDCPALRDMYLSSMFWILLDRGDRAADAGNARDAQENFKAAMAIAEDVLDRYPGNRLARGMKASVLYRSGRFAEALDLYQGLLEDYAAQRKPGRLPLGYTRTVGDLARVHRALGHKAETASRLAEWNRALRSPVGPWLPSSLKKDLSETGN